MVCPERVFPLLAGEVGWYRESDKSRPDGGELFILVKKGFGSCSIQLAVG